MPDYKLAERRAAELLEKYGYTHPPVDPQSIAEKEGLAVVYGTFKPGIAEKVSGFYEPGDGGRIVVNRDMPAVRKIFTVAHELGHYILHKEWADSDNYKVLLRSNAHLEGKPAREKEADCFAANLLVPLRMVDRYINIATIPQLAALFCVSEETIGSRLMRRHKARCC